MRKMRVALVILLLLTIIAASYTVSAQSVLSPKSMGDALSIGQSRATLDQIQKKLATGSSDIAKQDQMLSAYAKYKAGQNMANATKNINASKGKNTIKPPSTQGLKVPTAGIGDALKALGSINVNIRSPISLAKGISIPKLAVYK